ncbi:nose resistant to fluoxetine protein 6-like [Lycorma delicatula]|uniref:nose resistant to fluoxetine protein 6-like n=1 Tax=Lycorma delicatula TaxID=130591 RepID=UPI003F5167B7
MFHNNKYWLNFQLKKIILFILVFFTADIIKNVNTQNVTGNTPCKSNTDSRSILDIVANSTEYFVQSTYHQFLTGKLPLETLRCISHFDSIIDAVKLKQLWALKMMDASSKIQSGILEGNIADLGQYDECIKVETNSFKGQHCLVKLIVHFDNKYAPVQVPQDVLNGELTFTSAICAPSTCSNEIIQLLFNQKVLNWEQVYSLQEVVNITVKVDAADCHTIDKQPFTVGEYIVIAICLLFLALVIVSTTFDVLMSRESARSIKTNKKHLFFKAFSVSKNCSRLFSTTMAEGSLSCINGARFLCIAWVAIGHRYKFTCQQPLTNLLYLPDVLKAWWSMLIVNATLSVDVFFLLGGLLNSYVYMKVPGRTHNIKATLIDFVHRYLRLTPAYAMMVAITATWLYRLGDGPLWDEIVGSASRDCKNNWLPGIFYINNYYKVQNYCMMQSWYLAADMQMFWLSPLLLYPLWRWPKFGLIEGFVLIIISIIIPFYIAFVEEIKTPIPLSRDSYRVQREMETLYLPTHTKTISYIIGILLGYLIFQIKSNRINWNLSVAQQITGWVVALIFIGGSLFGAYPLFQIDHTYSKWESSLYIGFYKLFWGLGIGWVFLACSTGYGGIVSDILNCKPFIILGRLTYGIYLTHVAVIIYKLGNMRQPTFLSHYDQIQQFMGEFIVTIFCALALTLTLESPFLVMEKLVIKRRGGGVIVPDNSVRLTGRPRNGMEADERRDPNNPLQRTA